MAYALVTGGSQGIGLAIARKLAVSGYDILLIARSADKLKAAAAELSASVRCDWLAIDLAPDSAAADVFRWCGEKNYPVQVLVNNAGFGLSGPFENYTADAYAEMLHLNIITLVRLTRLFLPGLRSFPKAYILNIASSAAYQAVPFLSAYAASKSFVLSFTRGLRQELRGGPVTVTCISPGPTDTDWAHRAKIGAKGMKTAERFNMTPAAVAAIAVDSLFRGRAEVVTGGMNKLSAFMAWLMPKPIVEGIAKKLYD